MSAEFPLALRGLVDDAAVFPPGNAPLERALIDHREHRHAWYSPLVGPLLIPAGRLSELAELTARTEPEKPELRLGVIVDQEPDAARRSVAALPDHLIPVQFEARAPDSATIDALVTAQSEWDRPVFAEIPLGADRPRLLDRIVDVDLTPKFRTGGLSREFFPSPRTLAEAVDDCARRGLAFKLTAGLHRAVRHVDPATGFVHHGFVNVLAAASDADVGVDERADTLSLTEPAPLIDLARPLLERPRPLWAGFGSCSISEPLDDLIELSLTQRGETP